MAKDFGHEGASGEIIEDIGCGNNAAIRPCLPRKRFLTIVAEEVVVAHTDLPSLINASELGERRGRVQMAVASATRAEKNGTRARWSLNFVLLPNRPRTAHN